MFRLKNKLYSSARLAVSWLVVIHSVLFEWILFEDGCLNVMDRCHDIQPVDKAN